MLNVFRSLLLFAAFALALPASAEDARAERSEVGERIRQVERDGGKVLRAERMQRGGEEVYRIKVLTPEGRVRVLHDRGQPEASPRPRADRRSTMSRERPRPLVPLQRSPETRSEAREPKARSPRSSDD